MSQLIDLSTVPAPAIVEQFTFEEIVTAMLTDLRARDNAFTALVESDPAFKILEVCAYREMLMRQRVNEAAKACMLAYAVKNDLDNLGALLGVLRSGTAATLTVGTGSEGFTLTSVRGGAFGNTISLIVLAPAFTGPATPINVSVFGTQIIVTLAGDGTDLILSTVADIVSAINSSTAAAELVTATNTTDGSSLGSAVPISFLTLGVDEDDAKMRLRIQLSLESFSVAGPKGAYRYFTLSVPGVADASIQGPEDDPTNIAPGQVVVTVLGTSAITDPDHATAGESGESPILAKVRGVLNAETVRPLNDVVIVRGVDEVDFAITATIYTYPGPDTAVVMAAANAAVAAYVAANRKIGRSITRAGIIASLFQAGAQNVTLTLPAADVAVSNYEVGNCTGITLTFGGIAT